MGETKLLAAPKRISAMNREENGAGRYTCRSGTSATWNDSEVCDDCASPSPVTPDEGALVA